MHDRIGSPFPRQLRNEKAVLGCVHDGVLRARASLRRASCELRAYDAKASRRILTGCAGT